MKAISTANLKVADEVWIIVAQLHREQPGRADFTIEEIMERAGRESLTERLRPGVYAHVVQHCVANRAPNSGRYRMLYESAPGHRRLFRTGDNYHPAREGAKTVPDRKGIPSEYADLLDWYRSWSQATVDSRVKNDPLLALYGSGKDLWVDEHADKYVQRLREGWE